MAREPRVLSVLYQAFPPAPRAYLYCDDPAVIGAPFFVMERRRGVVVRGFVPPEFGGGNDPVANRKLSEVLIDTLVEFQAVDPKRVGLQALGRPEGFLARPVRGWTERWPPARARGRGWRPGAGAARRYAERSGRDVSRLPWYYVFGMFKIAVIVQQIYFRYHRGQTQDARFTAMGEIAERLMVLARGHASALG